LTRLVDAKTVSKTVPVRFADRFRRDPRRGRGKNGQENRIDPSAPVLLTVFGEISVGAIAKTVRKNQPRLFC
jgi:hypothetical protein